VKIISNCKESTYDLVMFSSASCNYNKYLYCNILSFLENSKDIRYRVCVHQINPKNDDEWLQKIKKIPQIDIVNDFYEAKNSMDMRSYCIRNRFCYFYDCMKSYNSDTFLFMDADLKVEKPLKKLVEDFKMTKMDICTKKKKTSGLYRALGIQLLKNNLRVANFYKNYKDYVESNNFKRKVDWHIFKDLEKLGKLDDIDIGDFSQIRLTDYIPFLHGVGHRKSEKYKKWMDEINESN
jgi:hypothetical protein